MDSPAGGGFEKVVMALAGRNGKRRMGRVDSIDISSGGYLLDVMKNTRR